MKKILLFFIAVCGMSESYGQSGWQIKADFGGNNRYAGTGFSIGDYGFIGTGYNIAAGISYNDFWKYDSNTDTWTQIADFGGVPRWSTVAFVISGKGYVGNGLTTSGYVGDFWKYDTLLNSWSQIADFGGPPRGLAIAFAINGKGYCGTGYSSVYRSDIWEYNSLNDTWTQKNDFGGGAVQAMSVFVINGKAYTCGGENSGLNKNTVWEYEPLSDTWTQKSNYPFVARHSGVAFTIGNYGYYGTGRNGATSTVYKDIWKYNPCSDSWIIVDSLRGEPRSYAVAFSIKQKGYVGTGGLPYSFYLKDFSEYNPLLDSLNPSPTITANGNTTFCQGDSVVLTSSAGVSYQWSNGAASQSITVTTDGNYIVTVTFSNGCSESSPPVSVIVNQNPSVPSILQNDSLLACSESGMSNYEWFFNGNALATCSTQYCTCTQDGFYEVTITDANGCISSSALFSATNCGVGIDENLLKPQLNVYPNPFNNAAFFELKNIKIDNSLQVVIYDVFGKNLFQFGIISNTFKIERKNLIQGIYYYEIFNNTQIIVTGKFIIQ